jgi:hypothetical protein
MHPADKKRISPRYVSALLIFLMSVCIVFVWLRNHDILLDLFDYSTVITAAGKVEHGFKPYTGVRSPMQSSVYLLNYATERVFGRNYLALTLGGLVQALLGALLVRAMLPRSVGPVASTLVALAVTLAGSLQHAVFFYNPLGILCLGIVLLGVAADPQLWPVRRWQTLVVFGALFLGGINKLNFQGATLVLAGLLGLAAWAQGMITGGTWFRNILLLALFGCALPLGFELAWTGATFRQWAADVIMLPAGREAMIRQVLDPGIYLRPLHDYHHHILIRGIAGVGLAVLLVTGGWMLWEARVNRRSVWVLLVRAVLLCAGCVLCALLITTNIETVVLTSLAYLILALALYLQFRQPDRRADLWLGRGLLGATLLWFAVGGYAAWHGSRVLYSLDPPPRSAYVRLEKAPPALSYLNGVRMLPEQIDALQRDAARMAALEDVEGKLPGVLFGPALEWFERAYPEAIVRRAPIWYDAGTSLREDDAGYFRELLAGGTRRLLTQRAWQAWPNSIRELLEREYRAESIGSRDLLYHPRGQDAPAIAPLAEPVLAAAVFRKETFSNVLLPATRTSPDLQLHPGSSGTIFGARGSSNWAWPLGAMELRTQAVARLDLAATMAGRVTFRVMADNSDGGTLLWETPVTVSPAQREVTLPLDLRPGGRPLWFQVIVEAGTPGSIVAGWREVRIAYATVSNRSPALPYGLGMLVMDEPPAGMAPGTLWFATDSQARRPKGWVHLPVEIWQWTDAAQKVRLDVELEFDPADPAAPFVVALAWYRAGRFKILNETTVDLRMSTRLNLEASLPETMGWVGLLTWSAGGSGSGHQLRIVSWQML